MKRRLSLSVRCVAALMLGLGLGCSAEDVSGPGAGPEPVQLADPLNVGPSSADLRWTASTSGDFEAYRVYRGTSAALAESTAAGSGDLLFATITDRPDTTITVDGLDELTTYYFAVEVRAAGGSHALSNVVSTATGASPPEPVVLEAPTEITGTSLRLVWSASATPSFESYRVYLSRSPGVDITSTLAGTLESPGDTTMVVDGLLERTTYYFAVYVFGATGLATASNEVSETTLGENHYLWVSDVAAGQVRIFQVPEGTEVAAVPTPARGPGAEEPGNLALSPDGSRVAAPFAGAGEVIVIERETWNTTAVSDTAFHQPAGAAFTPDGGEIWVANRAGGSSKTGNLAVIDAAGLTVAATVEHPVFVEPVHLFASGSTMYALNSADGYLAEVSIAGRTVGRLRFLGDVLRHGVASPDGSTLYITGTSDGISQLSAATLAVERGYSSAGAPQNVDVHEDGSRVYVGLGTDAILVITTSTGLTRPIVFSGAMSTYGVALVEAIGRGYVTDEDGGGVHVFDLQSEAEIPSEHIDLGAGSRPRAIVGS